MDTQQHTGWDPNTYLRTAAQSNARYLADTRDLITATTREEIAAVLTRTSGQRYEPTDLVIAAALGALGFRTDIIIRRLEAAEKRVAELEQQQAEATYRTPEQHPLGILYGQAEKLLQEAGMGTGNVNDDDDESLQFADESEWMDDLNTVTIVDE